MSFRFVVLGSVTAAALALLVPIGAAQATHTDKTIGDVYVSCSNGLSCDIWIHPAGAAWRSGLVLRRSNAPNAPVMLLIRPERNPFGTRHPARFRARSSVTFEVDGRRALSLAASDLVYDKRESAYHFSGPARIATLIDAFKNGSSVTMRYRDAKGRHSVQLPLSGFVGALKFMDKMQDRTKKTDALQEKGSRSPPQEAMVRDIRGFDQIPASIRNEFTGKHAICALSAARFAGEDGFEAKVGAKSWLFGLPCGNGNAYSQQYAFYLRKGNAIEPLVLPIIHYGTLTTKRTAWNVVWNQTKHMLTGIFKQCAQCRCGSYNQWLLKAGVDGLAFVLKESRVKDACDDNSMGGPQNWPRVWPVIAQTKWLTKINFALDSAPLGQDAPWYAAVAEGYYKDEGLNVSIVPSHGMAKTVQAIESGRAQIGIIDIPNLVLAHGKGIKLRMVAVIYQKAPYAIFSLKTGANVTHSRQLQGLTLGSRVGSPTSKTIKGFMAHRGLDPNSLKISNMERSARATALLSGHVPSIELPLMAKPELEAAARATNAELRTFLLADHGLKLYSNGIVAPEDYLRTYGEVLVRFVRASLRGWQFALHNPKQAAADEIKFVPTLAAKKIVAQINLARELAVTPQVEKQGLGLLDDSEMTSSLDFTIKNLGIKGRPPTEGFFSDGYVPVRGEGQIKP